MLNPQRGDYCQHCQQQTLHRQDPPSHGMHALFSLLTGGLWLIVWAASYIRWGGWRCQCCGELTKRW